MPIISPSGGGGGGTGPITSHAFSLTAVQIKAATLTPATLLAGQGANTAIIPVGGIIEYVHVTTAFPNDTSIFGLIGPAGLVGVQQTNFWAGGVSQTLHLGSPESQLAAADVNNLAYKLHTGFPGAVVTGSVEPGNGGASYAVNDTGNLTGTGDGNATYRVLTVDGGGAILTLTVTAGGAGYSVNAQAIATPGGGQPGVGNGGVVDIVAVDASGAVGDGTAHGILYYAVASL